MRGPTGPDRALAQTTGSRPTNPTRKRRTDNSFRRLPRGDLSYRQSRGDRRVPKTARTAVGGLHPAGRGIRISSSGLAHALSAATRRPVMKKRLLDAILLAVPRQEAQANMNHLTTNRKNPWSAGGDIRQPDLPGKQTLLAVLAAAVLVFAAAPAAATTYYVSQSSGDDSWTGQAASPDGATGPWKTLARASTDYVAGDRILLKCGDTWNEELHPKGSGTPENPIVIGSYGEGNKPVIDRQDYKQDLIGIHLADQAGYRDRRHRVRPLHDRHLRGILRRFAHQEVHLDRGLLFPRFAAVSALRGLPPAQDRPGRLPLLARARRTRSC